MADIEIPTSPSQAAETPLRIERRRPGRLENVSPELIPILRSNRPLPEFPGQPDVPDHTDDLSSARGVLVGMAISIPIWCLIGAAAWWIFD
jgi:hypothetical protein